MGFQPTTIGATDYSIARKPILGGEEEVYISPNEMFEMSSVYFAVANSGVETADEYNTYPNVLTALGLTAADFAITVKEELTATAETTISFAGTNASDEALAGTVVIKPPGYVGNTLYSFSEGMSWDIVPAGDTIGTTFVNKFKTLGFNDNATGGTIAVKSGFHVFAIPPISTFKRVSCITSVEYAAPMHPAVSIPCGMLGAGGGIKPGRTETPTLTLRYKNRGLADGLARYGGRRCTIMVVTNKESKLTTQRVFLGNAYFTVKPSSGDGNDEATVSVDGSYEYCAFFPAL